MMSVAYPPRKTVICGQLWTFLKKRRHWRSQSPLSYHFSCAEIEKETNFIIIYVIFAFRGIVIGLFCVLLQRSSEHDLLKQRSVMLDLL